MAPGKGRACVLANGACLAERLASHSVRLAHVLEQAAAAACSRRRATRASRVQHRGDLKLGALLRSCCEFIFQSDFTKGSPRPHAA